MKRIRKAIAGAIDWFTWSVLDRLSSWIYPEFDADFDAEFQEALDGAYALGEGYGDPLEAWDDEGGASEYQ